MSELDIEMQQIFLEDAKELILNAEQCFLNLEKSSDPASIIVEIFRIAHNLKGSAGAVGFQRLAHFPHQLEPFLLKIKNNEVALSAPVVSLLLECNDHLRISMEALQMDLTTPVDVRGLKNKRIDSNHHHRRRRQRHRRGWPRTITVVK